MCASRKQIAANRRNAQKSTGPVTPQGKARASQNAVTHGLTATNIVLNSPHLKEDPKEYRLLLDSLTEELQPDTFFQEILVHKIANCLWRYRRAVNAETAALTRQMDENARRTIRHRDYREQFDDEYDPHSPDQAAEDARELLTRVTASSIPEKAFRNNLLHYEMRLDRQLTRAYKLLRHLQYMQQPEPSSTQPQPPESPSTSHRSTVFSGNEPNSPQLPPPQPNPPK